MSNQQPDRRAEVLLRQLVITDDFEQREKLATIIAPMLTQPVRESSWVFVSHEGASLGNLPKHDEQVLFWYGDSLYVGFFLNDIRENSNPEGEKYSGDFGFFTEDENFYEAENVLCWMSRPEKPTNQIEGDCSSKVVYDPIANLFEAHHNGIFLGSFPLEADAISELETYKDSTDDK